MLVAKRIWVVDENTACLSIYKELLGDKYLISYFKSPIEFRDAFLNQNSQLPDLVITDLHFQDGGFLKNGEDLQLLASTPFVVISDTDCIETLKYCLAKGAIDCLMKPLRKSEILVKVEKYLIQTEANPNQYKFRLFESIKRSLGNKLTIKEVAILESFFKSQDLSATRKTIVEHVWINVIVNPKTLDVHLYNLRKKLNDIGVSITINMPGCWQLAFNELTTSDTLQTNT